MRMCYCVFCNRSDSGGGLRVEAVLEVAWQRRPATSYSWFTSCIQTRYRRSNMWSGCPLDLIVAAVMYTWSPGSRPWVKQPLCHTQWWCEWLLGAVGYSPFSSLFLTRLRFRTAHMNHGWMSTCSSPIGYRHIHILTETHTNTHSIPLKSQLFSVLSVKKPLSECSLAFTPQLLWPQHASWDMPVHVCVNAAIMYSMWAHSDDGCSACWLWSLAHRSSHTISRQFWVRKGIWV